MVKAKPTRRSAALFLFTQLTFKYGVGGRLSAGLHLPESVVAIMMTALYIVAASITSA